MAAKKTTKVIEKKEKKADPIKTKPKPAPKLAASAPKKVSVPLSGWLQDASLEVPVPASVAENKPGSREMEFSIGLRQQESEGHVRSEMRGRALVHSGGRVLALAEVSYVNVLAEKDIPDNLASMLYLSLRSHMENLLALSGHTPPLPATLDKVE